MFLDIQDKACKSEYIIQHQIETGYIHQYLYSYFDKKDKIIKHIIYNEQKYKFKQCKEKQE
jgi:hypothetical protein